MQAWPQREKGKDLFAGTQVKGAVTSEETETDVPLRVQESLAEVWVNSGLPQGQGHWIQQSRESLDSLGVPAKVFFRRSSLPPFTPTTVWLQAKLQGGNTAPPIKRKLALSMALPIRARPRFPHSQSLPSGSFHKPLILIHEGRQNKNHNHRKLAKLTTWVKPCLTQWNYEPCPLRLSRMDRWWWRVMTKRGSLEKGMANHFSIFALRSSWRVWKGKKI